MTTTTMTDLRTLISDLTGHVQTIRRDLHQHPELMFTETRTSQCIQRELDDLGIEYVANLARGTGVLAALPATTTPDTAPTIALRADMDALPIDEQTGKPYASQNAGVMHACGHDGHTSILLGAARALSALPERPNNVLFIFQPAEEGGAGGEKMCADGVLTGNTIGWKADLVYGLHGWPELELGTVSTRTGPLLASTDDFILTISAKGGHAAQPHFTPDPIVTAAHLVTALQTIASRKADPLDSLVCTVGSIHAGSANNIIPSTCTLEGTIRTLTDDTRALAEREFKRIVKGIAQTHNCTIDINWHVGYPVTNNHPQPTERFRTIAKNALGSDHYLEKDHPTMGGEDFAYYGKHAPACFFLLGLKPPDQSAYPPVHTPQFDFNDKALPLGIEMMCRVALEAL